MSTTVTHHSQPVLEMHREVNGGVRQYSLLEGTIW